MSTRRGGVRSRRPKHQNKHAFRHNKNSKKTAKIMATPIRGLCARCREKIEWRKKFRKYKPRKTPGRCRTCNQKNVYAAYHVVCDACAKEQGICAKCCQVSKIIVSEADQDAEIERIWARIESELTGFPERTRRTVKRALESGSSMVEALRKVGVELEGLDLDSDDEDEDDDEPMIVAMAEEKEEVEAVAVVAEEAAADAEAEEAAGGGGGGAGEAGEGEDGVGGEEGEEG